MIDTTALITLLQTEQAGFKLVQQEADKVLTNTEGSECLQLAKKMYASKVYQARMFAVLLLGRLAATHNEAYEFLRDTVVLDPDWRTQEMLARAFDQYCKDRGYETSMPEIRAWLKSAQANQRRAASEGLRIWTSRTYFKEHPDIAIQLLANLKDDESEYVRKSAGNALRDIGKHYPDLLRSELQTWDQTDKKVAFTYKLAARLFERLT